MWKSVQAKLADPGAAAASTAAGAAPTASAGGVLIKLSLVAAVVGGAIAIVAGSPGERDAVTVDATTPPAPAALPPADDVEPAEPVEVAPAPAPKQEPPADAPPPEETPRLDRKPPPPPAPQAESSLEREKILLRSAQRALKDGDPEGSFRRLREHERRFPRGDLAELRMALRVTVLCELGRTDQARAEAQSFLRARPGSPLAARVKMMCSKG